MTSRRKQLPAGTIRRKTIELCAYSTGRPRAANTQYASHIPTHTYIRVLISHEYYIQYGLVSNVQSYCCTAARA